MQLNNMLPLQKRRTDYMMILLMQIFCVVLIFLTNSQDELLLMFGILLQTSFTIVSFSYFLLNFRPSIHSLYLGYIKLHRTEVNQLGWRHIFLDSLKGGKRFDRINSKQRKHLIKESIIEFIPLITIFVVQVGFLVLFLFLLQNPWPLIGVFLLLALCFVLMVKNYSWFKNIKPIGFKTRYIAMQAGFVLATSIVPAMFIYRMCYTEENKLETKTLLFDLCRQLINGNQHAITLESKRGEGYTNFYFQPVCDDLDLLTKQNVRTIVYNSYFNKQELQDEFVYASMRPMFNDYSYSTQDKIVSASNDQKYQWAYDPKSTEMELLFIDNKNSSNLKRYGVIVSDTVEPMQKFLALTKNGFVQKRSAPDQHAPINSNLFYLLIILATLIWFRFMFLFIRKVFFPKVSYTNFSGNQSKYLALSSLHKEHVFVIGVPKSGKASLLNNNLPVQKFDLEFSDTLTSEETTKMKDDLKTFLSTAQIDANGLKPIVLIRHFENIINGKDANSDKLKMLENVLYNRNVRMVILSTIHPMEFFNDTADTENKWTMDERVRWINLMSNFYTTYFPITSDHHVVLEKELANADAEIAATNGIVLSNLQTPIGKFVMQECSHGSYLQGLRYEILKDLSDDELCTNDIESVIIRITNLARVYYMSLWLSLNMSEKKVLFDLAEDSLVNPENLNEVEMLCNKGLIKIQDGMISIINQSFRLFIVTLQNEKDLKDVLRISTEGGSWSKMRTPIIIVLMLLGGFILITQKEAFNSMLTYITAFSGGIFGIMKIVSMLPQSNKGSN